MEGREPAYTDRHKMETQKKFDQGEGLDNGGMTESNTFKV